MKKSNDGGGAAAPFPAKKVAEKGERLHKYLASTGAGSRRECETFIEQGRVSVNGKVVTKMGIKVDPDSDLVMLDGEKVKQEGKVYYLLNKPPGTICTSHDERGRPRVIDIVKDEQHRVYTVGRLDADSTGLILLTNDGAIANIVCHPRYRIEKTYQVVVRGEVSREQLGKVEAGVWLSEGKASPARVRPVARNPRRNETMLEITLFEGRNREVRRVFARVGLPVRRLIRTRLGPIQLGPMPVGQFVPLTRKDLAFVHEAEALYLANKEAWDAELPTDAPKMHRPFRPRPTKKGPPRRAGGGGGRRFGGGGGGGGDRFGGGSGSGGGSGGGGGGGGRPFPPRGPHRSGGDGPRRPYGNDGPGRGPDGPPRGPSGPGGDAAPPRRYYD